MTDCQIIPSTGFATLSADGLPVLDLSCAQGWSLEQLQIGFPSVRAVSRNRALDDGAYDDTRYVGQRAVSMTLRMNGRSFTQAFIDQVMPFMSPRRRPTLTYSLSDLGTDVRSMVLRSVDAPVVIDGPSYQGIVLSWVTVDSYSRGATEHCESVTSTAGDGRTYDLTFDRTYSPQSATTSITVQNVGNAPAPWIITMSSTTTDPTVTINGVPIAFTGVTVSGVNFLQINARERTILMNGDPTMSEYANVNYMDWDWDDLYLQPGDNLIEYSVSGGDESTMTICWYDTFI